MNGLTGGWTDTDLTELGYRQAAHLAARLKQELEDVPCQMVCSDLKRALRTAEVIGQEIGVTPQLVPALREFNNGIAAGFSQEEADRLGWEPTEPLSDWRPYPQAETWREFYLRVAESMDRFCERRGKLLIVVTHGGPIANIVAWWLQLGVETPSRVSFATHPASVSALGIDQWNCRELKRLNDTAHLYAAGLAEGLF